jgi:hypothetical protein
MIHPQGKSTQGGNSQIEEYGGSLGTSRKIVNYIYFLPQRYHTSHIASLNSQDQIYKNQNGTIVKRQVKIDMSQIKAIEVH